jgi:glycosyltransferase involved in cell wall biosynthesis
MEALACGAPVVASNLPGVREIAERTAGVTVLDLEQPDSAWAAAIVAAAAAADRAAIATSFRQSPFVFESFVENTLATWRGLIVGASPGVASPQ